MRALLPLLVAVAVLSPAMASDPGEPLDCSDWVFLEPGLNCQVLFPPVWPGCNEIWCLPSNDTKAIDVDGRTLAVRYIPEYAWVVCGGCNLPVGRTELVAWTAAGEQVLGYVEDRCVPDAGCTMDGIRTRGSNDGFGSAWVSFDPTHGRIAVSVEWVPYDPSDDPILGLIRISGFTTTFEILQSYDSTTNTIGYRVPYMPEGFPGASFFDTYYGALADPIDFSKARPLQCGYPATAPAVGDYLTVTDPLPDPPVNTGRYYITAANYMGQRRYGRQNDGGVLSGRSPASLPLCEQTEE